MLPNTLQALFSRNIYTDERVKTRQELTFKQPRSRTSQKKMCVSVRGVTLWNSLEQTVIDNNRRIGSRGAYGRLLAFAPKVVSLGPAGV